MWAQIISALLGLLLMAAPDLLALGQPAEDNFHIFGPIITTFAVVSWWEATRSMRLWNVPPALWLVASPVFLDYGSTHGMLVAVGAGAAVAGLSFVRGRRKNHYGGGWTALWQEDPAHARAEARAEDR